MKTNHNRGFKSNDDSRKGNRKWYFNKQLPLSDRTIEASGDPNVGHDVQGAKKYIRSRTRFHENAATRKMAKEIDDDQI